MRPKTPEEMYSFLTHAFWTRVYGDITAASRRKRLTEHDIAQIERQAIDLMAGALESAHEFPEFDARAVIDATLREGREGFNVIREARTQQIAKEH
ncbi:hypothetical protein MCBMB27_02620 [Methylobacterium phyllosphaerae]|uniref:Uncharacterized protein n=1 Tax=Methylobacterium phyllosphaerae TaxID=418223 RepID=A0AAE8L6Y4_9HYPH|nr:hypothetical protein [Methylobacterium phyllosphaerae]APT31911.1 hypothetical protein MCBMB27_02620 [Methylobacterium phyllosphaerae]SFH01702.1 hypothetical protein SAMN05192567_11247 [Methylobacterium phyllosphaerae]